MPKSGLLGERARLAIRFHVAAKLSSGAELLDPFVAKDAQKVSLDALPQDFQAKVDAELDQLKKSPVGSMMQFALPKEQVPPR
jgi:hypothetical protein